MAFPFREEPITPEEHELIRQASGALFDRCEAARGKPDEDQVSDEHDAMMRLRRRNEQVEKDLIALTEERDRIERNRDMYRGQVERQSATITSLRVALGHLTDEVFGLGGFGPEIKKLIGNEKWDLLGQRMQEAYAVLNKAEGRP